MKNNFYETKIKIISFIFIKHQVFQTKIINEPTTFTKDQVPFQHFDGRKYTVLMVAEKPSIARSIAEGLSG